MLSLAHLCGILLLVCDGLWGRVSRRTPASRLTAALPSWLSAATSSLIGRLHGSVPKHCCQLTENLAELYCCVLGLRRCTSRRGLPPAAVVPAIFPINFATDISMLSLIRKNGAWNWIYLDSG